MNATFPALADWNLSFTYADATFDAVPNDTPDAATPLAFAPGATGGSVAALTGLIFTSTTQLGTTVALLVGAGLAALAGLASSLRTVAPPPPAE